MYLYLRNVHAPQAECPPLDLISTHPCLLPPISQAQLDFFHLQFAALNQGCLLQQGQESDQLPSSPLWEGTQSPPFTEVSGFVSVP